ncbi:MAG TPA: hypothetical protein VKZ89_00215 [Thermobifida alba]|nr:hypothetical protein [Thermobifida alba]
MTAPADTRHWQVTSAAEELVSAAVTIGDQAEWMLGEKDLRHLAVIKAAIAEAKEVLTAIEKDIDPDLAALMDDQVVEVDEFRLERRGGGKRTSWKSLSLWQDMCLRSRFDPETGEELDPASAREQLIEMATACVPFTASLGWRTTALGYHGFNPDEYCETAPAPVRVEVVRMAEGVQR